MKMIKSMFLFGIIIFLSACGQKGPLYLPAPEVVSTADGK